MSAAFTPAPWLIERLPHATGFRTFIITEKRVPVATVSSGSNGPGHATANANLIAAAPDLYEALIEARAALWAIEDSAVESGFDKLGDIIAERVAKANDVLAKARGEQSL